MNAHRFVPGVLTPLATLLILILSGCQGTHNGPESDGPSTPQGPTPLELPLRVLILGDSISMGYTGVVQDLLGDRAEVQRARRADRDAAENCAGTTHGVQHIDRWLAQSEDGWDVIHFNFGLHDLKRVLPENGKNSNDPTHPYQADPELYGQQLREIVEKLEATSARLVFATTTPVPAGVRPYRAPEDPLEYNRVALELMAEFDIPVNDLFALAASRIDELQNPADVHFSKEGSRVLGEQVCRAILGAAGIEEVELEGSSD